MSATVEHELSVLISSHLVVDLERVCDYLVVLVESRVLLDGDVDGLLGTHRLLTGPRCDPAELPASWQVISASHTDRQSTLLIRSAEPVTDERWTADEVGIEDLVLAYMSKAAVVPGRDRTLEVQR